MKVNEEDQYRKDNEFYKLAPKINSKEIVILSTPNNNNFIERKICQQKN